jgi:hypothetical protein
MILTKEIFEAARTENAGWTSAQLEVLGVAWPPPKGNWQKGLIGQDFPEEVIADFVNLRTVYKDDSPWTLESKLAGLGCASYAEYLLTDHWQWFRRDYAAHNDMKCFVTGATNDLNLHHITYERLGAENDGDVVPLHTWVHSLVHRLVKEYKVKLDVAHLVAKASFETAQDWFS